MAVRPLTFEHSVLITAAPDAVAAGWESSLDTLKQHPEHGGETAGSR